MAFTNPEHTFFLLLVSSRLATFLFSEDVLHMRWSSYWLSRACLLLMVHDPMRRLRLGVNETLAWQDRRQRLRDQQAVAREAPPPTIVITVEDNTDIDEAEDSSSDDAF